MTSVIGAPCIDVKDEACVEECPVDCIDEGERSLYIQPDECVDCGSPGGAAKLGMIPSDTTLVAGHEVIPGHVHQE